jgi:hypothetical protein
MKSVDVDTILQSGAVEPPAGEPAKHAAEEGRRDLPAEGGATAYPLRQTRGQVRRGDVPSALNLPP